MPSAALIVVWLAIALVAVPDGPGDLRARHAALHDQLAHNQFGRPLYLESTESPDTLRGDVYAVVDHPFIPTADVLSTVGAWCDILILHVNVKYCRAVPRESRQVLVVNMGRRFYQPLGETYRLEFAFNTVAQTPEFFGVELLAGTGPLGTRDYRIRLEGIPVGAGQTFLHLKYSYGYGAGARLAMKAYLASAGRDRVGFTVVGRGDDGEPDYVAGVRGALERNTMRYYLAINAYLDGGGGADQQRLDRRLENWITAAGQYPRQLGDVDRESYLSMKRSEYQRQQTE